MNKLIHIENLVLQHYQEADKSNFIDLFMNEELCQFMAGGAFTNSKEAENLFYHLIKLNELENNENANSYGIFLKEEYIGHFEFSKKAENNNEIEIVYALKKEFWGKSIMYKVINYFNEHLNEQIVARVMINNTNSSKMLEKLGVASKKLSKFNTQTVIKYTLRKSN